MSATAISTMLLPRLQRHEMLLWSGATLVALLLHAGTGWQAYRWASAEPPTDEAAPAAIMIDLSPATVQSEAVPSDTPDTVDSFDAEAVDEPVELAETVPAADTPVDQVEEFDKVDPLQETVVDEITPENARPVEPEPVERAEAAETAPEVVTETSEVAPEMIEPTVEPTTAEAEEVIPDIVEAPLPEVAVAVPEPRPVEADAEPAPAKREPAEEPKPAAKAKPVEKPKPVETVKEAKKAPPKKQPVPKASIAAKKSAQDAPKAAVAAGANGGSGSNMSPATWQKKVYRHIVRRQRGGSGRGKVNIRFSVSPSGDVLSVSVGASSGNPKVDAAAVSLVERSSPVPAPPPDLPKAQRTIFVPIKFDG
ncbi:TonB family protein [Mesorhizobium sp. CN2-181]|uniref:energy transducer TonB family protein n=1 Tax=Mesorhizobium yinganensis TaxID=3157707 RepID=UPI0032B6FA3D